MNAVSNHPEAIVQPRRILVATDLCDSNYLLPIAIAQAKATGAQSDAGACIYTPTMPSMSAQGLVPPDGGMDGEEFAERIWLNWSEGSLRGRELRFCGAAGFFRRGGAARRNSSQGR